MRPKLLTRFKLIQNIEKFKVSENKKEKTKKGPHVTTQHCRSADKL